MESATGHLTSRLECIPISCRVMTPASLNAEILYASVQPTNHQLSTREAILFIIALRAMIEDIDIKVAAGIGKAQKVWVGVPQCLSFQSPRKLALLSELRAELLQLGRDLLSLYLSKCSVICMRTCLRLLNNLVRLSFNLVSLRPSIFREVITTLTRRPTKKSSSRSSVALLCSSLRLLTSL